MVLASVVVKTLTNYNGLNATFRGLNMDDKMLTPSQIAERLQVVERTVYRWLDAGVLQGVNLGRIWRIPERSLHAFIEAQMSATVKRGRVHENGQT